MSDIEQALTSNILPWREIEYRTKHFWVFRDNLSEGCLLFVPTVKSTEGLTECYQAAYRFGYNGIDQQKWDSFNIKQDVGEAAGQYVNYPYILLIPRKAHD